MTGSFTVAGDRVLTEDGAIDNGWIRVEGTRITGIGAGTPPAPPDFTAAWVVPGFVDIHVHGGGGFDPAESASALRGAVGFHRRYGTTSTLVSLVTAPPDELCEQLQRIATHARSDPALLGAHLEGPFLSGRRCGAQHPKHVRLPDRALLADLIAASGGYLRVMTVAPELPGARAVMDDLLSAGVRVAVGHTDADYRAAELAFTRGATIATHLFNAMPPLHHREPGAAGAALDGGAYCEVVNDGRHVHPSLVRLVASRNPDRFVLVTDAISATGRPDGEYRLGGQRIMLNGDQARLLAADGATGVLAGSVLTMDSAVRRAVTVCGIDPAVAVRAASTNAAAAVGADAGRLAVGARADLVAMDAAFRVSAVYSAGTRV